MEIGGIASKVGPNQLMLERGGGDGFNACCVMRLRGVNSLLCRQRWTYFLLRDSGFPDPLPQYQSLSIAGRGGGGGGGGGLIGQLFCCHECTVQVTQVFYAKENHRGKSMFSNEASSLRFNLNPGPPYAKCKVKC